MTPTESGKPASDEDPYAAPQAPLLKQAGPIRFGGWRIASLFCNVLGAVFTVFMLVVMGHLVSDLFNGLLALVTVVFAFNLWAVSTWRRQPVVRRSALWLNGLCVLLALTQAYWGTRDTDQLDETALLDLLFAYLAEPLPFALTAVAALMEV